MNPSTTSLGLAGTRRGTRFRQSVPGDEARVRAVSRLGTGCCRRGGREVIPAARECIACRRTLSARREACARRQTSRRGLVSTSRCVSESAGRVLVVAERRACCTRSATSTGTATTSARRAAGTAACAGCWSTARTGIRSPRLMRRPYWLHPRHERPRLAWCRWWRRCRSLGGGRISRATPRIAITQGRRKQSAPHSCADSAWRRSP
jgi:hypothetical protein